MKLLNSFRREIAFYIARLTEDELKAIYEKIKTSRRKILLLVYLYSQEYNQTFHNKYETTVYQLVYITLNNVFLIHVILYGLKKCKQ